MDPGDLIELAVAMLADARALTPAERELVLIAALGTRGHRAIARARGVARSTIKAQVGDLLAKTGHASLLELVADVLLVALSLACRGYRDGGGGALDRGPG